ncbi:hypothetical protein ACE3MZ_11795 [Paenibacillus sp. WLX1005]|uniref:rhamnogalacturonan lyase family protein n=1 Tax=Paenibacillus sp. WLX1005 TaxID=3243766 RepID=UPI003984501E
MKFIRYHWKQSCYVGIILALLITSFNIPTSTVEAVPGPRQMENLGRGIVAVRSGYNVFISWRLLALDPGNIGFNVYRVSSPPVNTTVTENVYDSIPPTVADVYDDSVDMASLSVTNAAYSLPAVKINPDVLFKGTNYTDTTANRKLDNTYFVKPVINGVEQQASDTFTLAANAANQPLITVPLKKGAQIRNVWVGDLDGDHEYDYIVDRVSTTPQTLEAYKRDGTLLWTIDMGPNSSDKNAMKPGSAAIDVGMLDGINVYDLDGDGKAEVILKIANGVSFPDGTVWTDDNDKKQWLAVLNGMTGTIQNTSPLPEDYITNGSLAVQLGIGYLNGTTPSVVVMGKNRRPDRNFNLLFSAYHYDGSRLTMDWKWLRGSQAASDGHQMRISDVDGNGTDEIAEVGFVLNGDGTLRYSLAKDNVGHGDRFYIGKFDPNTPGLQAYGIQQLNAKGLLEYYYNADTGKMYWQHSQEPPAPDVGRGDVGDIDPRYPGYEVWSFSGIYNGTNNTQITGPGQQPWPALRLWWDGDLSSEIYNNTRIEKWNYESNSTTRLVTAYKYQNAIQNSRKFPVFYGDIMGDWREEVVLVDRDYSKLIIFTTSTPTDQRIYTLAQNPAYRNSMTIKGYVQSHLTDYYLGEGMSTPPTPNIRLTP